MRSLHLRYIAALAVMLLAVSACEDEDRSMPCRSLYSGGVIEGHFTCGDVHPEVRVLAGDVASYNSFGTVVDASGSYRLEVPSGTYALYAEIAESGGLRFSAAPAFYSVGGPPYGYETRTDLTVTADTVIVADFALGSMKVALALPTLPPGASVDLEGLRIADDVGPESSLAYYSFSARGEVQEGQASFAIGGLQPGSYLLKLDLSDRYSWNPPVAVYGHTLWLPPTRQRADAETVVVAAAGTAHFEAQLAVAPAHLTGTVRGSWQELYPRPLPQITLVTPDSSATVATFSTLTDGTFAVAIQMPEPVRMLINIGGSQRWYPAGRFSEGEILELTPGSNLPPIEVVESGIQIDIRNPLYPPTCKGRVQLLSPVGSRVVAETATSNTEGRFPVAFCNLDAGDYWLRILPRLFLDQAWRPQWYDRAAGPEDAVLVRVPPNGGVVPVTLTLEEGGQIAGEIRYMNPQGEHGVILYVTAAGDPTARGRLHPSGSWFSYWLEQLPQPYAARGLPDGDYKIGIWPQSTGEPPAQPPEDTIWYPATTDWNAAQVLTISGAQAITGIDFDLR